MGLLLASSHLASLAHECGQPYGGGVQATRGRRARGREGWHGTGAALWGQQAAETSQLHQLPSQTAYRAWHGASGAAGPAGGALPWGASWRGRPSPGRHRCILLLLLLRCLHLLPLQPAAGPAGSVFQVLHVDLQQGRRAGKSRQVRAGGGIRPCQWAGPSQHAARAVRG